MLKHLEKRRQEEEGFTLIELMVVVLIMGILMAIAIPTFLSTRGSAYNSDAESNATNAFTNEKSYYASNQAFEAATGSEDTGPALDSTLPWGDPTSTTLGVVAAYAFEAGSATTDNGVVIEASSKSGDCFYIADVEGVSSSVVGYYASKTACVGSGATSDVPTSVALNTSSGISSALTSSTTWSASW